MDTINLIHTIEQFYISYGYPLVFVSSFVEITPMGWMVPGGVVLAVGGFFAYSKSISFLGVLLWGWFGAWTTLILAYLLGKKSGMWLVKKLRQEKNTQRAKRILDRNGAIILTSSMLANMTRFWTAYVAGMEKYNWTRFLFYSGVASLTWVSLMGVVGYLAGSERSQLEASITRLGIISWVLLVIAAAIFFYSLKKDYREFNKDKPPDIFIK